MASLIHLNTRAGRLATFFFLYLSEGLPIGYSTVALAAYLRRQNVSVAEVGAFTAAVIAPWGFKWAWAPLVDLIRSQRWGPSRAWILTAQTMMIGTMATLVTFDLARNVALLSLLSIIHNIFAATQDVAIDAMAVRVLPDNEKGLANGFMFGGQYLGIGIGGSGALYLTGIGGFYLGLTFVMAALAVILVGVTIPLRDPPDESPIQLAPGLSLPMAIWERIRLFLRELYQGFFHCGIGPLVGVVVSVLPSGAVALSLALSTTMQVDMNLSENVIGNITLAGTIAGALGCIAGGWISDRSGRPRLCVGIFYALTTLPTFYLATQLTGSSMAGVTVAAFLGASVAYNFAFGMQTGTVTALFMTLTNPSVAATQFTGYMALHNVMLSYSSVWQGRASDIYGYRWTLTLDGLIAFIPILLLPFLRPLKRRSPDASPDR